MGELLVAIIARVSSKAVVPVTMSNSSLAGTLAVHPRVRVPVAKRARKLAARQRILQWAIFAGHKSWDVTVGIACVPCQTRQAERR